MNHWKPVLLLALTLATGAGCGRRGPAAPGGGRATDEIFTALDTSRNTKFAVTEYWKSVLGKEYESSGLVIDVRGRRNMAEVQIYDRGRQSMAGGYNLVLLVPNLEAAAKLRKNDHVRFKGYLASYRSGRQGGVVVTLKDAEVRR